MNEDLRLCPMCGKKVTMCFNMYGAFIMCIECGLEAKSVRLQADYAVGLRETKEEHEKKVIDWWNGRML